LVLSNALRVGCGTEKEMTMKWILVIFWLIGSFHVRAVSMENEVFALEAGEIRFKLGQITASDQVIIRVKSSQAIQSLTSNTQVGLSQLVQLNRSVQIMLGQGWQLTGQVHTILFDRGFAIIAAQSLLLVNRPLLAAKI